MSRYLTVSRVNPTGEAVFVGAGELWKLDRFKTEDTVYVSGGVYTLPVAVKFTSPFTDFGDCRIVLAGGSLHGYAPGDPSVLGGEPSGQIITALSLGVGVPFITSRGSVFIQRLTIFGVAKALDLDGTAAAAGIVDFDEVFFIQCLDPGTIANYAIGLFVWAGIWNSTGGPLVISGLASVAIHRTGFLASSLVLSGLFGTVTLWTSQFFPLPGVTAISTTDAPLTTIGGTLDIVRVLFFLDFASAVGVDIKLSTLLGPEALDLVRAQFTTSTGGPPIGTTIPAGAHDAASNSANLWRCAFEKNSADTAYYTTMNNAEPTPIAVGGTPVVAILTGVGGAVDVDFAEKFTITDAGRVIYTGGLKIRIRVTFIAVVTGQANKKATVYVGTGGLAPGPVVPAAAVLRTGVPIPLSVTGNAASAAIIHAFDVVTGSFAEPWITEDVGVPTVEAIKVLVEKIAG